MTRSSTVAGGLVLRRRDLGSTWWWGPLLGVVGTAGGCVLLVHEYARTASRAPDPAPSLCVLGTGVVSLVLFARQRAWIDATGVHWRWVRSGHVAWTDLAAVVVVQTERGADHVVAVRTDGRGQVLAQVEDADRLVAEIERWRPADQPAPAVEAATAELPDAAVRPGRILATASLGQWSMGAASNVVYVVLLLGLGLSAPWMDAYLRVLAAGTGFVLTIAIVLSFRRTRAAIAADGDTLSVIRWSGVERLPMPTIERFVAAQLFRHRTLVVAIVDGRGRGFGAPMGSTATSTAVLVDHLERLRRWSRAHPDDLPDPDEHDPMFRPHGLGRVAGAAIPAVTFVIGLVLLAGVPFAFVAAAEDVVAIEARSLPVRGDIRAVSAGANVPQALVEYPTAGGPLTIELPIAPAESGRSSLDLRYDPTEPHRVWRAGTSPDATAWPFVLALLAFVPMTAAIALALHVHPPSATGRRGSLYAAGP